MDTKAFWKLSYGLYVIGVETEMSMGGCVVDAMVQATTDPPVLLLCSNRGNYTNECIKKAGEFSVSVLSTEIDPFVIANFGFQSSRTAEKWQNVPCRLWDGLPVLRDGCCAWLRCRVIGSAELSTHTVFTCEITDAELGEGEPLLYADYQKHLKAPCMAAWTEFRKTGLAAAALASKPAAAKPAEAPAVEAKPAAPAPEPEKKRRRVWVCNICGYEYDGDTPFEKLPDDWKCPICNMPKSMFSLKEV